MRLSLPAGLRPRAGRTQPSSQRRGRTGLKGDAPGARAGLPFPQPPYGTPFPTRSPSGVSVNCPAPPHPHPGATTRRSPLLIPQRPRPQAGPRRPNPPPSSPASAHRRASPTRSASTPTPGAAQAHTGRETTPSTHQQLRARRPPPPSAMGQKRPPLPLRVLYIGTAPVT